MSLIEARDWTVALGEIYICFILTLEYFYDANKDWLKKQRKTKTTKKTTTEADGRSTTEEVNETVEPTEEKK